MLSGTSDADGIFRGGHFSYQLSVISYQLSVISKICSAMTHLNQLSVIGKLVVPKDFSESSTGAMPEIFSFCEAFI
ncbi:hypothetical protein D4Z78_23440 [Okeania hirsuta]|nr:hypothetical protein D4Z78_23440 [Okeania hirsuta]